MAPGRASDALDVERRRGDVKTCVEATAIGIFNAREDPDDSLDGGEAGLTGIAAIGHDPIDLVGGCIDTGLDAAMPLLDGRCGDEFGGGSGAEIVLDVGFQRWLVAFEGEEIIRLV